MYHRASFCPHRGARVVPSAVRGLGPLWPRAQATRGVTAAEPRRKGLLALLVLASLAISGCGTTRWSDTSRTATEQLLLSDAIDRAISEMDFHVLNGQTLYLDTKFISGEVDERYLVSTLRQHMIASGCMIRDKPEEATWILEIRSGAIGTNRSDLLFGVPATTLPTGGVLTGIPSAIPEIPLVKRTAQIGVCKIAVFAYDRVSGRPVWQSGTRQLASRTKDVWIFGAGPFTRGTIHDGTVLAGEQLAQTKKRNGKADSVWVAHEIQFPDPQRFQQPWLPGTPTGVMPAAFYAPISAQPINNANAPGSPAAGGAPGAAAGSPPAGPSGSSGGSGSGSSNGSAAGNGSSSGGSSGGGSSNSGSSNSGSSGSGSSNSGSGSSSATSGTTSSANPAAGALGAVNALDWAHSMLGSDRTSSAPANSTTPQTSSSSGAAATSASTSSPLGQMPAVLRLKGL